MAAPMSFFNAPLGPARTVQAAAPRPSATAPGVVVSKRVQASLPGKGHAPAKRVKGNYNHNLPREPLTPQPSSEDAPRHSVSFKIPALPAHMASAPLTPTTSTVAASSSPRRLPSSPRHASKPPQIVFLEAGSTLLFGRHHVRGNKPPVGPAPANIAAKLVNSDAPARTVILDREARHASRVHAAIELVDNSIRIVVEGQNGMRIRKAEGTKFRRLQAGTIESFPNTALELDFYGSKVLLRTDDDDDETEDERLFTPPPEEVVGSPLSLPPSSPPLMPTEMDLGVEGVEGVEGVSPPSRSSSPLSELEIEVTGGSVVRPDALRIKAELLESTVASSSRAASPRRSRASTPIEIPPVPENLDLPALLASTVVFSGSSKLSLPDLVRSLLESQPSLREYSTQVWSVWASRELESNSMFGKITRNGRDASGRPLQSHYFYNPVNDPDAGRAAELGGLVRPLRAAQRSGGKTIDWRPVGRRRY